MILQGLRVTESDFSVNKGEANETRLVEFDLSVSVNRCDTDSEEFAVAYFLNTTDIVILNDVVEVIELIVRITFGLCFNTQYHLSFYGIH